jgi:hypothetical protein
MDFTAVNNSVATVTMEHKQWKPTTLNLNNFKMIEAMELKIIASRSPWMELTLYQISQKPTTQFKIY